MLRMTRKHYPRLTAMVTLSLCLALLLTGCLRPRALRRPGPSTPPGEQAGAPGPAPAPAMGGAPLVPLELARLEPLPPLGPIQPTGRLREFKLEVRPARWEVGGGVSTDAITFNGTVPGPLLRATEGDTVRVVVTNKIGIPMSIHWHGLHVPNPVDGVPPLTQDPITPGQTYTYQFIASHAGTFIYHPHLNSVELVDRGLYGAFLVDPQRSEGQPRFDRDYVLVLSGWSIPGEGPGKMESSVHPGMTMPGKPVPYEGMYRGSERAEKAMKMQMDYNYWTINGKAFPATEPTRVRKGERVRLRLVNISNLVHPMHLHGHDFRVIAKDGHPIAAPQIQTVFNIGAGETADLEFLADNPGQWVFHCHELHHATNNGVEPGGLITVVQYEA